MNLKKTFAILLAALFVVAALAMAASADGTVTVGGASYEVKSPQTVAITGDGVTPSYRGNGSIDVLKDGDAARSVTNHDNKGIVLIVNDEIAARASVPVVQDIDNIPVASIEMDFGSNVSFDTAYMAIYWQQAGIYEPDGNKVIIETSSDGKVWVPVGDDGNYYFSIPKCPDWVEGLPNSDQGYPYIGEVAIPLGETVKARYVLYSYTFPVLEEGSHWTFYTNVAEFIGFTEVGVANFKSGRKPAKLTAKDVAERPAIVGSWVVEDGEEVSVVTFKDDKGELAYTANVYDKAAYLESGEEGEVLDTIEGNYFIEGNTVVLITSDGYDDYKASIDGDGNLIMDMDGEEYIYYTAEHYAAANGGGTSTDTSSDDTSSGDEPEASGDTSSAASDTTTSSTAASSAVSSASSAASSAVSGTGSTASTGNSSATSEAEEGGISTTVIVIIIAAVVVIAGAVAAIIIVRKKKS